MTVAYKHTLHHYVPKIVTTVSSNMLLFISIFIISISITQCQIYSNDLHFRVEAGQRMCFFETGKVGDLMEVYYQVVDGQHGDLDISLDVMDPAGVKIISDYKKSQNAIIRELLLDGEYAFCLDNSFSTFNSKMVFIYVLMEGQDKVDEAIVTDVDSDGNEVKKVEVLSWQGVDQNGKIYEIEVADIADSLSRTLKQVLKARLLLDLYGATKSKDTYLAYEETFVVDLWSSFQITFMFIVGLVQVCMIKKLFKSPSY